MKRSPGDLKEFLHLHGCIVISTGCATGTRAIAEAFLQAGCRADAGPDGCPNGAASLFYTLHLCCEWLCKGTPLGQAHARASPHDAETGMFRLYESQDDRP